MPMWVLLPAQDVPLLVISCMLAELALPRKSNRPGLGTVLSRICYSAFALGPALVLTLWGPAQFSWTAWPTYLAALGAQFLFEGASIGVTWFAERSRPATPLEFAWMYMIDFCLAALALPIAATATHRSPTTLLLVVPILLLMVMFTRERQTRYENYLERSHAERGTAELMQEVVADDDINAAKRTQEVAALGLAVSDRLGLKAASRQMIEHAALLGHITKVRRPAEVLKDPDALSQQKAEILREHEHRLEHMLGAVDKAFPGLANVLRHVPECYDGSGYPDGLSGDEIPIESRVIAGCDAWTHLIHDRPHRPALSIEVAFEQIKRAAGHEYDPNVIRALLAEVGPAYAGDAEFGEPPFGQLMRRRQRARGLPKLGLSGLRRAARP
ncbi:MAG: hypothetical protein J2O48_10410 [Solirubrobacterales bacterium]|nr:hypothetical protein [Solirubrobacterales bacterium]